MTNQKLGTYFIADEAVPVSVSMLDIQRQPLTPEEIEHTAEQIADEFGGSIPKAEAFAVRCICAAGGYTPDDIEFARRISSYLDWLDGE